MNQCCNDLLQEIKSFIKEKEEYYKGTRRHVVAFALRLLRDDLVFKYETMMTESNKEQT